MRLYKMELYKLCHKKSFMAGLLLVLFIGFFFFCDDIQQYPPCIINDTEYTGFQAIQANRRITEEFRGILTDEKAEQIIAKYGFPNGEPDPYNRLPGNFLNTFIMKYASDGYNNGWDDYRIATETIPLADTELGRYHATAAMAITLEYYDGWKSFLDRFGIVMLGVSILILYSVSVLFSGEEQTGMKPLMFTTKEGPSRDVIIKIAAAFSVSVGIWFLAVLFNLLLYTAVYGTDGLHCIAGLATRWILFESPLFLQPLGIYAAEILAISLLAVLELCAITICISARSHSSFHAVTAAGACYAMPFLGYMLYQSGWALLYYCSVNHPLQDGPLRLCHGIMYLLGSFIYSSPVYLLVDQMGLIEISRIHAGGHIKHIVITLAVAGLLSLWCTISACRRYRKPQTI